MTFVVCTGAHGTHRPLLDVTGPALERYAERHGASFVVLDHRLAPERPAAWDKVLLLRDLICDHDFVIWIDADALVLDGAPSLADQLAPARFFGLVEHTIRGARVPNTGVLAIRSGYRARMFLDSVWKRTEFVHHRWWDNAAVLATLGYRIEPTVGRIRPTLWRRGVEFLDKAWNSIPDDPADRPFVVHYPGLPISERLARLRSDASAPALRGAVS